jgi:uncharacterized protein
VERPGDLFDRENEWADLVSFASTGGGSGIQLGLVRGRRRQGKSFLLRRLAKAAGGFYHQAVEEDRVQALDGLGRAFGEYLGVPGGRLHFDSWVEAVGALTEAGERQPGLIVLDEFPYLLHHSPELPSVLQRAIDASRDQRASTRLILCGSALSTMASLLSGTQALRGRANLDLVVQAFDFRTAANFWGFDDWETAFNVHAVLGGTPGYRDLLPATAPKRLRDFGRWIEVGPLNPSSAMFREDDYLLTEERSLTDRSLYHSVVTEIAKGRTSQSGIAAGLGRQQRSIQFPLKALEESGFVVRTDDLLRDRRPVYTLADPIVRFHHVVTRPNFARFEDRDTSAAWAAAQPPFRTHVLGPHFEDLAREFTRRFASPLTIGGRTHSVGSTVLNDSASRSQHEVDVVATGRSSEGAVMVLAIGEAKFTTAKRTLSDLHRLENIRTMMAVKHPSAVNSKLLLFAGLGFEQQLLREADGRSDVELIDLARMYTGS